jgi:hypothetical protein
MTKSDLDKKINKELEDLKIWLKQQDFPKNSFPYFYHFFKRLEKIIKKYKKNGVTIYDFSYDDIILEEKNSTK